MTRSLIDTQILHLIVAHSFRPSKLSRRDVFNEKFDIADSFFSFSRFDFFSQTPCGRPRFTHHCNSNALSLSFHRERRRRLGNRRLERSETRAIFPFLLVPIWGIKQKQERVWFGPINEYRSDERRGERERTKVVFGRD